MNKDRFTKRKKTDMKTKMNIKSLYIVLCGLVLSFASCRDYMTEIEPGTIPLEDFFVSTDAAVQNVTGCYTPTYHAVFG